MKEGQGGRPSIRELASQKVVNLNEFRQRQGALKPRKQGQKETSCFYSNKLEPIGWKVTDINEVRAWHEKQKREKQEKEKAREDIQKFFRVLYRKEGSLENWNEYLKAINTFAHPGPTQNIFRGEWLKEAGLKGKGKEEKRECLREPLDIYAKERKQDAKKLGTDSVLNSARRPELRGIGGGGEKEQLVFKKHDDWTQENRDYEKGEEEKGERVGKTHEQRTSYNSHGETNWYDKLEEELVAHLKILLTRAREKYYSEPRDEVFDPARCLDNELLHWAYSKRSPDEFKRALDLKLVWQAISLPYMKSDSYRDVIEYYLGKQIKERGSNMVTLKGREVSAFVAMGEACGFSFPWEAVTVVPAKKPGFRGTETGVTQPEIWRGRGKTLILDGEMGYLSPHPLNLHGIKGIETKGGAGDGWFYPYMRWELWNKLHKKNRRENEEELISVVF